jgi:hypothetical protein
MAKDEVFSVVVRYIEKRGFKVERLIRGFGVSGGPGSRAVVRREQNKAFTMGWVNVDAKTLEVTYVPGGGVSAHDQAKRTFSLYDPGSLPALLDLINWDWTQARMNNSKF